jgi:hypothetical protein
MKNIKIYRLIHNPIAILLVIVGIGIFTSSCDSLLGYERVKDYDYVTGSIDPHINQTAMEFIDNRLDSSLFKHMKSAIEYVGMRDVYEANNDYTYLMIKDQGFRNLIPKYKNSGFLKDQFIKMYVYKKSLLNTEDADYNVKVSALATERDRLIIEGTIEDVPVDSVKKMISYHIIKKNVGGSMSWRSGEETWYETLYFDMNAEKGKICFERDGRYNVVINKFDGSARNTKVAQQGIIPTNGMIEVLNSYIEYKEK